MTWLPTPYTVQRLPYDADATDVLGNDVPAWGDPVDVPVHGWAPPSPNSEPSEAGRSAVVRDLDVYAPPGTFVAPKDRMVVAGETFDVVGYPDDFTHGPWSWQSGVRIALLRVEG